MAWYCNGLEYFDFSPIIVKLVAVSWIYICFPLNPRSVWVLHLFANNLPINRVMVMPRAIVSATRVHYGILGHHGNTQDLIYGELVYRRVTLRVRKYWYVEKKIMLFWFIPDAYQWWWIIRILKKGHIYQHWCNTVMGMGNFLTYRAK